MIRYTVYKHYYEDDKYTLYLMVRPEKENGWVFTIEIDELGNHYMVKTENLDAQIYRSWIIALLRSPACANTNNSNFDRSFYREVEHLKEILPDWNINYKFCVDNLL